MIEIMEGDQYGIGIRITDKCGHLITDTDVEDVEVCIGKYIKTYANNEVTYEDDHFVYPLTQEESFSFNSKSIVCQIRVKFPGGDVIGEAFDRIDIKSSKSKEVL